jgi:orotate phosphoribosyltransferase
VVACATLDDLVGYLQESPGMQGNLDAVRAYRAKYGVNG